jgi:hypothetical protein
MTMMGDRLAAMMLIASLSPWAPAMADQQDAVFNTYNARPATLLDLFVESTKRTIDAQNLIADDWLQRQLLTQELRGEKYRSTLPQKDLDLHSLSGGFAAATVPGRFTASYSVLVSPFHSILSQGLEDEATYRKFFGRIMAQASDQTRSAFFSANSSLQSVDIATRLRFEEEIASRTRIDVEWMIFASKDAGVGYASRVGKALAAKGIAVRLYFGRCRQVSPRGEEPKQMTIVFQDFQTMDDLDKWQRDLMTKDAEREFQDSQQSPHK